MRIAAVGAAVVVDLDPSVAVPAAPSPPRPSALPDAGLTESTQAAAATDGGGAPPPPPPTTTTTPVTVKAASQPRPTTTTTSPPPPPPTTAPPTTAAPTTDTTAAPRNSQTGGASWYDAPAGTCAHRSLPFGTIVTVTNQSSGASTTCRVADRGPYVAGRIIDLSRDTFARIASTSSGVIEVRITW